MARTVNIHEAKTHLSELVAAVERGEEIVVARRGTPVVRLVLVESHTDGERPKRKLGWSKGKFWYAPNFDESLEKLFDEAGEPGWPE